jgi:hypothetical protein
MEVTIPCFHTVIQDELEKDLTRCLSSASMLPVCLEGMSFIAGFCGGLREEEMPLMSLDATRKYYSMEQPKDP